jgi:two-component system chemotaxis sensor kinase CheA
MNFEIFDTHLEAILILNNEEKIVYCNEVFAQICDLSRRKIMGKIKFRDIVIFTQPNQEMKPVSSITTPTPYVESIIKVGEQSEYRVQYTVQRIENESQWLVYFKDVTLEERLQKKYRAELQQKEGVISQLEEAKLQLEDYSKNLEMKVQERSEEILKLNIKMKALLDSLTQGFLIFNQTGDCLEVYSQACQNIFQKSVAGTKIWDLFHLPENKSTQFKKWMTTLFAEMLPFEDLKPLGPARLNIAETIISLDYYPLRNNTAIDGVVVVASDITNLIQAQNLAHQEKVRAQFILQIVTRRTQFAQFVRECTQMLNKLKTLSTQAQLDAEEHSEVLRILHTLKGGASIYSLPDFPELCHHLEERIKDIAVLTDNIVQELWSDLNQEFARHLNQAKLFLSDRFMSETKWYEINSDQVTNWLARLNHPSLVQNIEIQKITNDLKQIGDVPAQHFFEPYREMSTQLANKLGKSLKPLLILDHQVKIPPEPYSQIFGCLVHIVRNAIDHGIETPEARLSQGKQPEGQLMISIQKINNANLFIPSLSPNEELIFITIKDDGKGISPELIKRSLLSRFPSQQKRWNLLSEQELIEMIFMSEFSTQENVTQISGRGVGLDAVKTSIEEFGGKVKISTELNKGTQFLIYLSATLHLPGQTPMHKAA